jgi:hypothetical protein
MRRLSSVFGAVALLAVAGPLPARACTTDADCDNGNVCDGVEYCQAGVCFNRPPLVCDDSDPCTQNTCDPTLGCQFPATAGCMVGAVRMKLGSRTDLRVLLVTDDNLRAGAFPPANGPDDPVLHGASLRLYSNAAGNTFDNTYGMPGTNWFYLGTLGSSHFGYIYKDQKGTVGPIRVAVVRNGKPTKMKGSGPSLNFTLGGNPHPLHMEFRFGNLVDCLVSGGAQLKFDPGITFQALHVPPPATCP